MLKLHGLFSDHMVLQRGRPIPVYGTADAGAQVAVRLGRASAAAAAGPDGRWRVELPAREAGGPHELSVRAGGETVRLRNVLVGDVWVCSGQSNMEWTLGRTPISAATIASTPLPRVRLFTVTRISRTEPAWDVDGGPWLENSPESAASFSAVAWHFARRVARSTDVPLGMIHTSWGGTPVRVWMPYETLRAVPGADPSALDRELAAARGDPGARPAPNTPYVDPGNEGEARGWAAPGFDDSAWPAMDLPAMWQARGMPFNGAVWFRREVELPPSWAGRELRVELGAIDDHDQTYFDGERIGGIGRENPGAHAVLRSYAVPAARVRPGRAVLAVRVFDHLGQGGFSGPAPRMRIFPADAPAEAVPLKGAWRYQVELELRPVRGGGGSWCSTGLYNAMIHPLLGSPVRGALWYQGESDASLADLYAVLFPAMIRAWRERWGCGEFPFYYVQLANFREAPVEPADEVWPRLREAQDRTLAVPHTGMAVAIDVGEALDVHPRDKRTVGERLARLALNRVYGVPTPDTGPRYHSHEVIAPELHVRFDTGHEGLRFRYGGKLRGFAIRGEDGAWRWANARLESEDTVALSHPDVPRPAAARYAWADNPDCNLENDLGLPAAPFRTDAD